MLLVQNISWRVGLESGCSDTFPGNDYTEQLSFWIHAPCCQEGLKNLLWYVWIYDKFNFIDLQTFNFITWFRFGAISLVVHATRGSHPFGRLASPAGQTKLNHWTPSAQKTHRVNSSYVLGQRTGNEFVLVLFLFFVETTLISYPFGPIAATAG